MNYTENNLIFSLLDPSPIEDHYFPLIGRHWPSTFEYRCGQSLPVARPRLADKNRTASRAANKKFILNDSFNFFLRRIDKGNNLPVFSVKTDLSLFGYMYLLKTNS